MPAEQPIQSTPFDISPITDQDLQKPGPLGKLLARNCEEMKSECRNYTKQIEIERTRREQVSANFHSADSQCKVLEAKLEVLNNRDAISQLLWGAASIVTAMLIEFIKTQQWSMAAFCAAIDALLGGAVLLLHGFRKRNRAEVKITTAGRQ